MAEVTATLYALEWHWSRARALVLWPLAGLSLWMAARVVSLLEGFWASVQGGDGGVVGQSVAAVLCILAVGGLVLIALVCLALPLLKRRLVLLNTTLGLGIAQAPGSEIEFRIYPWEHLAGFEVRREGTSSRLFLLHTPPIGSGYDPWLDLGNDGTLSIPLLASPLSPLSRWRLERTRRTLEGWWLEHRGV